MKIVTELITLERLKAIPAAGFGTLVKAVVDVETGVMAVDGELHADQEALLLEDGSSQGDLWGSTFTPM